MGRLFRFALCCLTMSAHATADAQLQEPPPRANAPVFKKLHKGINIDTSLPSAGVWPKVQHDVAHFEAAANAGFTAVRVFMPYGAGSEQTERQIHDALAHDLAIVICMWGNSAWAQNNIDLGVAQIAKKWGTLAKVWKKYSGDLVFEILNEPKGIGYRDEERYDEVMQLYNAAAQAIRTEDPTRPILIGAPASNDPEFLDPYVTKKYLTYTFDGGRGFYDDTNAGVAIHFYNPRHEDGVNFAMWTAPLPEDKEWKPIVSNKINTAVRWRESIGADIPIVTTEWGCWTFSERPAAGLTAWLAHHMSSFRKYGIGSMYYTGIQSNQRSYAIFDSEMGWNQVALDQLTGVRPTKLPATSQIINSEFHQPGLSWRLTSEKITAEYVYGDDAFSGNSMLRLTVPEEAEGQLFQQTYAGDGEYIGAPGKTLLHLIKGETYRISFIAASAEGDGRIKVMLKNASTMAPIYDSSAADGGWISLVREAKTHARFYTHSAESVMDVRLEFDVGSLKQVLYLDRVELMRE